jgi:hypothetical protein
MASGSFVSSPTMSAPRCIPVRRVSRPLAFANKRYQQWSRHRTAQNPWRPGLDNVCTHLLQVNNWLEREFKNERTMRIKLRMTQTDHQALVTHLLPGDGMEAVAVALCGRRRGEKHHCLTVRRVVPRPARFWRLHVRVDWRGEAHTKNMMPKQLGRSSCSELRNLENAPPWCVNAWANGLCKFWNLSDPIEVMFANFGAIANVSCCMKVISMDIRKNSLPTSYGTFRSKSCHTKWARLFLKATD